MELLYLETVDSTNKFAKENLSNIADKTLIYAGVQTAGRGRLNRKWNSNLKSFYLCFWCSAWSSAA